MVPTITQSNAQANAQADIEANAQADIEAQFSQADIEANAQADIEANAQADIEANAHNFLSLIEQIWSSNLLQKSSLWSLILCVQGGPELLFSFG